MKASLVDLRYKSREILAALDRNESVTLHHLGRIKGIIRPVGPSNPGAISGHAFFGMHARSQSTVEKEMQRLRQPRYVA